MEKLKFSRKCFLKELVKAYGYTVEDTYKGIVCKIGGVCYTSVRNYLSSFKEMGILTIERKYNYQIYYLDKDKVNKIINE
jgi:DNA-binding transcriptional ArsR family regulator